MPSKISLGSQMALIGKIYFGALTRKLEKLDIDRYFTILILVDESQGKATQQSLADELFLDKSAMVRIIDHLVDKGYLKRAIDNADRRKHILVLTSKARKAIPIIQQATDELDNAAFKGIASKSRSEFLKHLIFIKDNLAEIPADMVRMNIQKVRKQK